MSKQKSKKDFKNLKAKDSNDFIDEESDKKSIILILIAIVAVLGLILLSIFLFDDKQEGNEGTDEPDVIVPIVDHTEEDEEEKTSKKVAVVKKYTVKYLDVDGNQIGKTQKVLDLEDRVNEKPPRIECKRFREWRVEYDKAKEIFYYIATYVDNVERVPEEEEPYLNPNSNYVTTISKVETEEVIPRDLEVLNQEPVEDVIEPTYLVEVNGEVSETDLAVVNEEISEVNEDEVITIDEEYSEIIALRFNAPEDVTKEDIEQMYINVYEESGELLSDDKYHHNGEEWSDETKTIKKTGRQLLDSTDEEYENNIFYFNYYQEVDDKENTLVEVYWGNDPDADPEAIPTPIPPKDEYVEVYEIDVQNVEPQIPEDEEC